MSRRARLPVTGQRGCDGVRFCGLVLGPPKRRDSELERSRSSPAILPKKFQPCDDTSYRQGLPVCWLMAVCQLFTLVPELHDMEAKPRVLEPEYYRFVVFVVLLQGCVPHDKWPVQLLKTYDLFRRGAESADQPQATSESTLMGGGMAVALLQALLAPQQPKRMLFEIDNLDAPFALGVPWRMGGANVGNVIFRAVDLSQWQSPMKRQLPWALAFLCVFERTARRLGYALLGGLVNIHDYDEEEGGKHSTCFTVCLESGKPPQIAYRDSNFRTVLFVECAADDTTDGVKVRRARQIQEQVAEWTQVESGGVLYPSKHQLRFVIVALRKPDGEEGKPPLRGQYTA